ncbi:MAG: hypothetical protein RLP09_00405 [Sandaracinaceae bacterium]
MRREPKRYEDLEAAIDGVVESYGHGREIDNLESAALPNKRAVVEAFHCLEHVLFMGFYATRALNETNLGTASPSTCTGPTRSWSSRSSARSPTTSGWAGPTASSPPAAAKRSC